MKIIRFILNIIRATFWLLMTGHLKEFYLRALSGIPQIWAALTVKESEKVDEFMFVQRMTECRACPVFDNRLLSCGNPWDRSKDWEDVDTGKQVPMGCFCHMETKAQLKDASCWLNEETNYAYGWKRRD